MSDERDDDANTTAERVIAAVAEIICNDDHGHPVRVAVDGVTAAGKSTFARTLTQKVQARGRPAIHLTMDGFHHRRKIRHRQGRESAAGYYEDAYDFAGFVDAVLRPLGPSGDRRYRPALIDLATDEPIEAQPELAPTNAVVIVDGSFLGRPELTDLWEHRIFLRTTFEAARRRGVARDADALGGEAGAHDLYERRYHAAAHRYLREADPERSATIVVDNDDPAHPAIIRP